MKVSELELASTRARGDRAVALGPAKLRTVDVIHLASALEPRGDLQHLIAYDHRLLEAARRVGLSALAPA